MAKLSPKTPLAKAFSHCAVEELSGSNIQGALEEIVDAMVAAKVLPKKDRGEVLAGLLKREELGTTAIGKGVALPHVRRPDLKEVVGAIGHSTPGIDCRSLDGHPTHTVCVMLTPVNPVQVHLDFMTKLVGFASDGLFTRVMNQTTELVDFVELFEEKEAELAKGH